MNLEIFSLLASENNHNLVIAYVCASFYFIALLSCAKIVVEIQDEMKVGNGFEYNLYFYFSV